MLNLNNFMADLDALFAKHELFFAASIRNNQYNELAEILHDTAITYAEHDPSVGIYSSSPQVIRLLEVFKDACNVRVNRTRKCIIYKCRAYVYDNYISNDPFVIESDNNVGFAYALKEEFTIYPLSDAPFFKTIEEASTWADSHNIEVTKIEGSN